MDRFQISSSNQFLNKLKADLAPNVKYDSPDVLAKRLRIHEIDDNLVNRCTDWVRKIRQKDIADLITISQEADESIRANLSRDSEDELDDTLSSLRAEKDMYRPLGPILATITEFWLSTESPSTPRRVFICSPDRLREDSPLYEFSESEPAIQLIEYWASQRTSQTWNDRDGFARVKPSQMQGPKGRHRHTVQEIVLQTAEYARHYLTCRPLLLFCVGLLVFGTRFCVGIYDRQGVVFSTIHDMFDEMDVFVRVIRSVSHLLSIQELGLDPTVRILTDDKTTALTGHVQKTPSAIIPVSSLGLPTSHWCTIGHPIWTSPSLFGRGTVVWAVRRCFRREIESNQDAEWVLSDGDPMVLKTSWRSSSQTPESQLYNHLQAIFPDNWGLAKFEIGGDVPFPECDTLAAMKYITVDNLRNYPNCGDISSNPTPVLHRLVLSTVGDHMWNYDDDLHLLRGFRDALLTHKELTEKGFLHRDINPGNIFFVRKEDKSRTIKESFLSDVKSVRCDPGLIPGVVVTHEKVQETGPVRTHGVPIEIKRGATMTGNVQFMAVELINLYIAGKTAKHEPRHDIESFIWSMIYCIMRHIAEQSPKLHRRVENAEWRNYLEEYKSAFGQPTMRRILLYRGSQCITIDFLADGRFKNIVNEFVSRPLIKLVMEDLSMLLFQANLVGKSRSPLTYDSVLAAFEEAIQALEIQANVA